MSKCDEYNPEGQHLEWQWTAQVGSCIYNTSDKASFVFGWISVVIWALALTPQIIKNFMQKSAKSQSFLFWSLWLAGDVFNLAGCLLTHNLITNTALAALYFSATLVAFLQVVYYGYFTTDQDEIILSPKAEAMLPADEVVASPFNLDNRRGRLTPKSDPRDRIPTSKLKPLTRNNLDKFNQSMASRMRPTSMTPNLYNAIRISRMSPRIFGLYYALDQDTRAELDTLEKKHLLPRSVMMRPKTPPTLPVNRKHMDAAIGTRHGLLNGSQTPDVTSRAISDPRHVVSANHNNHNNGSGLTLLSSPNTTLVRANHNKSDYGSLSDFSSKAVKKSLPAVAAISVTALWIGQSYYSQQSIYDDDGTFLDGRRSLLGTDVKSGHGSSQHQHSSSHSNGILSTIGIVSGIIAAVIYVVSRVPQLHLILTKKEVAGISPLMFCLSFSGNFTQTMAMLVRGSFWTDGSVALNLAPWMSNAFLCMLQDCLIVYLVLKYRKRNKVKDKMDEENEDGNDPEGYIQQTS